MLRGEPSALKGVESRAPHTPLDWLIAAALALITFIAYMPVLSAEFVNYDDHRYITMNQRVQEGLTLENVAWAFTTFEVANWHPLTWVSHMLDCAMFRQIDGSQWAGGHHLVNLLLHISNAALIVLVFARMTGSLWRSTAIAALFALHPLHVESVAWVSERKDVLSTMFGLLAIGAYGRWVRTSNRWMYIAMLALFACSLMSKPMLVTLPALQLVLDVWPLRRIDWRARRWPSQLARLAMEKLPLVLLSAAATMITIAAQRSGGAVATFEQVDFVGRLANALVSIAMYLVQTLWPVGLAPFYPRPAEWPMQSVCGALVVILAITVSGLLMRQRHPHVLSGWLWFLFGLSPVIGLITIGSAARADRYTYVPLLGVFWMMMWTIPAPRTPSKAVVAGYVALVAAVLGTLAVLTYRQAARWHDSITLGLHAISVTQKNAVAHFNLANAYVEKSRIDLALPHFESAAHFSPGWADVPYNHGNALLRLERFEQAREAYSRALSIRPDFARAHSNLAIAAMRMRDLPVALDHFAKAAALEPGNAFNRMHYGLALAVSRETDAAIKELESAATVARAAGDATLLQEIEQHLANVRRANSTH